MKLSLGPSLLALFAIVATACAAGSPDPAPAPTPAQVAPGAAPPETSSSTSSPAASTAVTRGAAHVRARGCPLCHQSTRAADGTLSGQTSPWPGTHAYGANLTPDPETGIGGWTDGAIVRAIREGVDDEDAPLCALMPHFDDMTDAEAGEVLAYLHSLPPVKRAIPASACDGAN